MPTIRKLSTRDKPYLRRQAVVKCRVRMTLQNNAATMYYQCSHCERLLINGDNLTLFIDVVFLCPTVASIRSFD